MQYFEIYGNNQNCQKCNSTVRLKNLDNGICQIVKSKNDSLPCRCVGEWGTEKITRLVKYFQIFSKGMKGKWPDKINYIEICSGPGFCIDKETGNEFDGTAISILKNEGFKHISKVLFIDNETKVIDILNKRIENLRISNAKAIYGDYTDSDKIAQIISENINQKCLNLVFIDPTDCSVPFKTISTIKREVGKIDFIINVATKTDFNRNITNIISDPIKFKILKQKYIDFLGYNIFEKNDFLKVAKVNQLDEARRIFREVYKKSMRNIGFEHFDIKEVQHYYDLLFASCHSKGLEFWNKANRIEPSGQRNLF